MAGINQLIGYALSGLGLIGLAVSNIPLVATYVPLPAVLKGMILTIVSVVLVVIGLFFLLTSGSGKGKQAKEEVPIYQGSKIVGYRKS